VKEQSFLIKHKGSPALPITIREEIKTVIDMGECCALFEQHGEMDDNARMNLLAKVVSDMVNSFIPLKVKRGVTAGCGSHRKGVASLFYIDNTTLSHLNEWPKDNNARIQIIVDCWKDIQDVLDAFGITVEARNDAR
jgi:hypothetical protein